jgi:hypothetical protein
MACGSRSRRTSETVDEYEKLVLRMNPPRLFFFPPTPFLLLCRRPLLTVPASWPFGTPQGHRGQRLRHDCHLGEGKRRRSSAELFLLFLLLSLSGCSFDLCLLQVDSANKYGTLLEVVQVLTDLKLTINRAYISSDGEWFMDGECRCLPPCRPWKV